jgi:hypothetical protein
MLEDFSSKCSKSYVRRLKRDLQVAPECVVGLLDDIAFSKTGYTYKKGRQTAFVLSHQRLSLFVRD